MPPSKSAEARQHTKGLLTQCPSAVLETLSKDTPYLSNGRAKLHTARLDLVNVGRYHSYETAIVLAVDGKPHYEYRIANRPAPASWDTEKGRELRLFVHRCYDRLHDLAWEAEQEEAAQVEAELQAIGRRNDARLVEEWRRYW